MSHFSYAELLTGELKVLDLPASKEKLRDVLKGIEVFPIDESVIDQYAQLAAALNRQGMPLAIGDLIIAATALVHDRILVTRNLRHFERVPNLQLLNANLA